MMTSIATAVYLLAALSTANSASNKHVYTEKLVTFELSMTFARACALIHRLVSLFRFVSGSSRRNEMRMFRNSIAK